MNELLKKLCTTFGVSSAEALIVDIVTDKANQLGYSIKKDRLGSIIVTKESKQENAPTLMLAAPIDEVGFMVSEVKDDGSLAFIGLESLPIVSLLNQRVTVLCQDNTELEGIICGNCQLMDNQCSINSIEQLSIKLFETSDTVKAKVNPGDLVSFTANYEQINQVIVSKALFPRVLNATMLDLMVQLKDQSFDYNIAFAFVSQSIIGYRGTMTATYVTRPDVAIALTCFDANIKHIKDNTAVYVGLYDRQMIPNIALLNHVKQNCTVTPIVSFLGNDGSFIHKTLQGTPTLSMGVAVQSMGSVHESILLSSLSQFNQELVNLLNNTTAKELLMIANGVKK